MKKYFDTLTDEEAAQIMAPILPEEYKETRKLDKTFLLQVFRSSVFKRQVRYLESVLNSVPGSGMLMSQSLKFDYTGEGVGSFLRGISQLAAKDRAEKENKDQ